MGRGRWLFATANTYACGPRCHSVLIGNRKIGPGEPTYIISEGGINHNGDVNIALQLMKEAANAGADAFKLQKRSLPDAIPAAQQERPYSTPWGEMSYIDYKYRMEFDDDAYLFLASEARACGIDFGVSVWDSGGAHWAANLCQPHGECFDFLKIPSALITNEKVVHNVATRGLPFFWSTGMSDMGEIHQTRIWLEEYGFDNWGVLHCNSSYPAALEELNLKVIEVWKDYLLFRNHPVGYSGHESGLATTVAAVALGASVVERHITLDRAMWGSDQAASVEPQGFARLVRDIRAVEMALGDGHHVMYDSEIPARDKLRNLD